MAVSNINCLLVVMFDFLWSSYTYIKHLENCVFVAVVLFVNRKRLFRLRKRITLYERAIQQKKRIFTGNGFLFYFEKKNFLSEISWCLIIVLARILGKHTTPWIRLKYIYVPISLCGKNRQKRSHFLRSLYGVFGDGFIYCVFVCKCDVILLEATTYNKDNT